MRVRRHSFAQLSIFAGIGLAGCATVDYRIPEPKYDATGVYKPLGDPEVTLASITKYEDAATAAEYFADYYRQKSNNLYAGVETFEIPLIAGGISAAAGAVYNAGKNSLAGIALAIGGVAAYETYLSPRQRAGIDADGMNAMLCLQQLALQYNPATGGATGPALIAKGIVSVNLAIAKRERSQSGMPDVQQITTNLQNAATHKAATLQAKGGAAADLAITDPIDIQPDITTCVQLGG